MASWIIPCNPKYYDVFGAFRTLNTVDWRQTAKSIEPGDIVYIYTGRPVQAITHAFKLKPMPVFDPGLSIAEI